MPTSPAARLARHRRWFAVPDRRVLVVSLALQLGLALLLGHSYDTRVFMGTGYLVGTGQDPYVARDLTSVFHHVSFDVLRSIGYPPPWPLLLGLLYRASYAVVPNLLLYNLVLKLPVVAATVGLAGMVAALVEDLGQGREAARRAFRWLSLNPLVLLAGAAWGQIDVIATLVALGALVTLRARRRAGSAVLLALAVCIKPIALPLLPAILVHVTRRSRLAALRYGLLWLGGVAAFYLLPFYVFGWSRLPLHENLNRHFIMAGTMSLTTVARVVHDPILLAGHWWLLGVVWVPALAVVTAIVAARRAADGFEDLLRAGVACTLVVFLTRTWLAEPNVVVVLPLALILTVTGALDRRLLTALWVLPVLFTVADATPLQLLWVAFPGSMQASLDAVAPYGDGLLVVRAAIVVAWQIVGWWAVVACLRGRQGEAVDTTVRRSALEGVVS